MLAYNFGLEENPICRSRVYTPCCINIIIAKVLIISTIQYNSYLLHQFFRHRTKQPAVKVDLPPKTNFHRLSDPKIVNTRISSAIPPNMRQNVTIAVVLVLLTVAAILGFVIWKRVYAAIVIRQIERMRGVSAESSDSSSST